MNDQIGVACCEINQLARVGRRVRITLQTDSSSSKKPELVVLDAKPVSLPMDGQLFRATKAAVQLSLAGVKLAKMDSGIGAKSDPCILLPHLQQFDRRFPLRFPSPLRCFYP